MIELSEYVRVCVRTCLSVVNAAAGSSGLSLVYK